MCKECNNCKSYNMDNNTCSGSDKMCDFVKNIGEKVISSDVSLINKDALNYKQR